MQSTVAAERVHPIRPYIQLARIDHWFKNAFMLLGAILAFFFEPSLFRLDVVPTLVIAFLATCLVASSNYVLNEVLDAPFDRKHPTKQHRPAAAEQVRRRYALAEWLALGAAGVGLGLVVHPYFAASALALWVMGIVYNVRPIRTKELAYLDVLSESVNNALRLLLGWFALIQSQFPPVSLIVAYWMAGAFFMAIKRFAEYRQLGDRKTAKRYRRSFAHYTEDRLLVSAFFYVVMGALFTGVFIVRYHLELILVLPLVAGFFAYYMQLGLKENSPVQNPEKLHRERGFLAFSVASGIIFILLMFTHIPVLYELFNVELAKTSPLWTLGP
jgi:decaprenyl-phosphate phosphoribosyltransferase